MLSPVPRRQVQITSIYKYIHHEAFLDIYLFGIIVVFGVFCFLGLVWWIIVIDPCIRFFGGCLTIKCKIQDPRSIEKMYLKGTFVVDWGSIRGPGDPLL